MFAEGSSCGCRLSNGEPGCTARGIDPFDDDVVDSRPGRTPAECSLDAIDRFQLALDQRLDASIRQVADPPVYALDGCSSLGKVAKADSLHVTTDQEPAGDDHETPIMNRAPWARNGSGKPVW
jgi:hypothetical protein